MARPRWWTKKISPTISGAIVSAGPMPMPWTTRAASKLLKVGARPHHMLVSARSNMAIMSTTRRPKMFASGTQNMFERPIIRTLTAIRCVNSLKGRGGRIWYSNRGNAGAIAAEAMFATAANIDMVIKMASLRHMGQLRGSAGL